MSITTSIHSIEIKKEEYEDITINIISFENSKNKIYGSISVCYFIFYYIIILYINNRKLKFMIIFILKLKLFMVIEILILL